MTSAQSMPEPVVYIGKPREPVTAVYYDGNYQNGQLLEIKVWLASLDSNLQLTTWDAEPGIPFYLNVYNLVTNKGFDVSPDMYVFQETDGQVRALPATIFEILFQVGPEV
jgi:hypothetical protein